MNAENLNEMNINYHSFHIPVMGTGYSADTPIRVAHLGISSVISIVDDILLEKMRKYYSQKFNMLYQEIPRKQFDGRAKRITAYLDMVKEIVGIRLSEIKKLPFFENNDKDRYFRMLPDMSLLKQAYYNLQKIADHSERTVQSALLTNMMIAGSIDVNIMAKVDGRNFGATGHILSEDYSDAKSALRGFANSKLNTSVIISAGFNRSLCSYITNFSDFYRQDSEIQKKKIIIKVSDFRSALIQGKFLAAKGLEVSEFRIESGLNCGGHAFASSGYLLPSILREFKEKRQLLKSELRPLILKYYGDKGWNFPVSDSCDDVKITVQGGIGTNGEVRRLIEDFGCNATGWGSPFLLVPEATCVDSETRGLLKNAKKEDLYLSDVSPLGVPFNNLRHTGSELWTKRKAESGKPGSACPKGYLVSNTEFSDRPICTASRKFQVNKTEAIRETAASKPEQEEILSSVYAKVCLCEHLGNSALIALGLEKSGDSPQAVCPGPNIVWFNREYSLEEMVDHIYGRGASLVPEERPHMFCQEMELYVTYFEKLLKTTQPDSAGINYLETFRNNLIDSMKYCLIIAERNPYPGENLNSIPSFVIKQKSRLESLYFDKFRINRKAVNE